MTAQASLRELPIRIPIADGESLHSWIEALAARYRMTVRELLPALGIPAPRTPYGLMLGVDSQALRSLEWQAGLPIGRLDDAVLDRFSTLDLAGAPGRPPHVGWQTLWAKSSGSRFCPRCLAENGGRWSLSWYLNWTFACMRHNVLMATRCGICGRRPRSGENRLDHFIDGRLCCHYRLEDQQARRPDRRMPRCGASLIEQPLQELDIAHPIIACQRWIHDVLAEPAEVTAAGLHMPPKVALTAVATLMRHAIVASDGLINRRVAHLAATPAAKGISLPEVKPVKSPTSAFAALADNPALFGIAAALAVDVLTAPSLSAAADPASYILASTDEMPWSARRRGIAATRSPLLDAVLLRQQAAAMSVGDRLSYRTEGTVPRRPTIARAGEWPFIPGRLSSVPVRLVPQVAWKPVTDLLTRHALHDTGMPGAVLSMAIVRCGTYAEWSHIAAWLMLPSQTSRTASSVFRRLGHAGRLGEMLVSIDVLVEELTEHPPPIDYARRRWIFRDLDLVTPSRLRRACHQAGLALSERRIQYATMLLWETLTGGDIRFANNQLCFRNSNDRESYASFRRKYADALEDYLTVEAERLMLRHRIDEPVTWQPELKDPAGLKWLSPPADLTRHLPGWESAHRREKLRQAARDHTPRVTHFGLAISRVLKHRSQSDTLQQHPSFLIDLANWPSSGQISETLAK
jgi:hypothetical protein